MSCHNTRAVLDGEAPHLDVSPHLLGCSGCRSYADELTAIDDQFHHLLTPRPAPELVALTLAAIDAEFDADLDAEIDDLFAALPPPPVADDLISRTLAAIEAEPIDLATRRPRHRQWGPVLALAAAAALLLVAVLPDEQPTDPALLTEKGDGVRLPSLGLKVAVARAGGLDRHRAGVPCAPGDALYFRVASDTPTTASLIRIVDDEAALIHQQPLSGGEEDLRLGERPLAWTIEPGEQSADFVLLAGEPLPAGAVDDALASDDGEVCAVLSASLDVSCQQIYVEVTE
jgi:hypothetical protein